MSEISVHALAVLIGVCAFGVALGIIRFLQIRRLREAAGAIRRLEGRAATEVERADAEGREIRYDEELPTGGPSLYGIPYLAWILTSLVIPAAFGILFYENLIAPYRVPTVGSQAWHAYKAPAGFQLGGRTFDRHEVLITRGGLVSERDRQLVSLALENRTRAGAELVFGSLLLLVIFGFILLYHINILYPTSTEKNRNLILIFLTILITLSCAKISLFYDLFSPYLIPVPWAGMVITIFINRRIVPLIMLTTLIFVSIVSNFDFGLFIVLLAGGLVSGSWVRQAKRRSQLISASVIVGVVMLTVYVCYWMAVAGELPHIESDAIAVFLNGIVSGLLTLITLPAFEFLFDYASPFRLMELLDLNTPALKELFFKAPGTYQHTMATANIAEAVANEIGANGLLVRVGSYYHDIGKMFNPQFFIENQTGVNPHDNLGPVASAAVVRSHVILGVKLARQIRLPGPVIDFIPEHHGTSTIDYFYYKSRQSESEIKSERIFKYPGPKPQSKETAIVMLVDSVEAAFRVIESRDEESIRRLVNQVANRKLQQGELDRSGLTIGQFKKIAEVLIYILKSTSHQRIQYPSSEEPLEKPEGAEIQEASRLLRQKK